MKILLSIRPDFVKKIFDGEKMFEFRKSIFSNPAVTTVVVYATMPIGKVVGEFKIKDIHRGHPTEIWERTQAKSGISLEFFSDYFNGRDKAYAIEIGEKKKFDSPKTVREVLGRDLAPQSFAYIHQ